MWMVSDYIDEDLIDSHFLECQVECFSLQIVLKAWLERPECLYKDSISPPFVTILARAKIT